MTWTSPATPTGGTAITVSFYTTNIGNNLSHLRNLVPDASASGKVLTSTSTTTATFQDPVSFTAGMIMGWNASNATIPSGWTELTAARDCFIIGANGSYAFDATGGAATVNIQHSHDLTTSSKDMEAAGADDPVTYVGGASTEPGGSTSVSILPPYIAKTWMVKS